MLSMLVVGYLLILCYNFPIVNYTIRLLVNLICYRRSLEMQEKFEKYGLKDIIVEHKDEEQHPDTCNYLVPLIIYMITCALLLILVFECIAFYIECVIYILVGNIINLDQNMKFLTLFLLIAWYAFSCFSAVCTRYKQFAKVINTIIQNKVRDRAMKVAMQPESEQTEQAFTVPVDTEKNGVRMKICAGSEGYLKWTADRLLLFLDVKDITYIPKDFFFKAAAIKHFYCPKPAHILYLKACFELVCILLFLGFVILVVLSFGNNISGINQTLVTLLGGSLPIVFARIFRKPKIGPEIDKGYMPWIANLDACIKNYSERWPMSDFEIDTCLGIRQINVNNKTDLNDVDILVVKRPYGELKFFVQKDDKIKAKPKQTKRTLEKKFIAFMDLKQSPKCTCIDLV